ncbi:hypothetical protein NG895_04115 [Aeoliella sp. ICT_H6.2]|uniref:Uncharacterized protein n=1 Tax=Aeoliella straminimaris TaxID=2954799 RepID=A0A9X2F6C6_9BACT|nr:hypothetical protein [Aeoliella straminimaris]MCO6043082.1 hypothetical protein [Aeoliella straminimaris]
MIAEQANTGPTVRTKVDPNVLSPEEKSRLRSKVRIVVACCSATVLLLTFLVLLALSR